MRVNTYIDGIFKSEVPSKVFQALAKLCPEGIGGSERHAFGFTFDQDDARAEKIVKILENAGLKKWTACANTKSGKEFTYRLIRVYDDSDLAPCELLHLCPDRELVSSAGREKGFFTIHKGTIPRGVHMARNVGPGVFICDRLRQSLRRNRLIGATTRKVIPTRYMTKPIMTEYGPSRKRIVRSTTWRALDHEPWWELTSKIQMPPLHPSIQLLDAYQNPVPRGYDQGFCGFSDGFYRSAEHKYLRSDIEKMPPFDIATSAEGDMSNKWLIVSNRYYRYCRAKKIKGAGFRPVRILE